ncbi:hypothetical protein [Streptomyces wuyuanensis]|uniref:hypothetical protein n=1 Tax=Streptomyces wuyuanensis TaxID=1196353 RepID=UPI003432C5F7
MALSAAGTGHAAAATEGGEPAPECVRYAASWRCTQVTNDCATAHRVRFAMRTAVSHRGPGGSPRIARLHPFEMVRHIVEEIGQRGVACFFGGVHQSHAPFSIADGFRAGRAAKAGERAGGVLFEPSGDPAPRLSYALGLVHRHVAHTRRPTAGARRAALVALEKDRTGFQVLPPDTGKESHR